MAIFRSDDGDEISSATLVSLSEGPVIVSDENKEKSEDKRPTLELATENATTTCLLVL